MSPWIKFFRVRNLITVPGDALVGAVALFSLSRASLVWSWSAVVGACAAGVLLYMFGLADNDIVGAKTDPKSRPLVSGEISMGEARIARVACLLAAVLVGYVAGLPPVWRACAMSLATVIMAYNRTKSPLLMGLCRGFDVLCGTAAICVAPIAGLRSGLVAAAVAAIVWTAYIAGVTKYSEREVFDPTNDHKVALLVYGLMGLQAVALIVFLILGFCDGH